MTHPAYLQWQAFTSMTPSSALHGRMVDLHQFLNAATWRSSLRDVLRFFFYLGRLAWARRATADPTAGLLFVVDNPGVGGVLTLLPLLDAMPTRTRIVIAAPDFVCRLPNFRNALQARSNVTLIELDRCSGRWRIDWPLVRATLALVRRLPRLAATVPLFLLRDHAYSAVARRFLEPRFLQAVIVFNERMLPSACFSSVARQRGIRSIAVQHGNFVENYLPVLVDRYLTWGAYHSDWLARHASFFMAEAIGSPRMDALAFTAVHRARPLRARPFHLVFFSQVGAATVSPEMVRTTRLEILKLVNNPAMRVTIKLHPLDSASAWRETAPDSMSIDFLDGRVSLADALGQADVACSFYSTVLVEALLWKVPVIQLNPFPGQVASFPESGGIASVVSADELWSRLEQLESSDEDMESLLNRQQHLAEGYFSNLGRAADSFWNAVPTGTLAPHDRAEHG